MIFACFTRVFLLRLLFPLLVQRVFNKQDDKTYVVVKTWKMKKKCLKTLKFVPLKMRSFMRAVPCDNNES